MKINKNFIFLVVGAIVLYLIIMILLFYRNNSDNWKEERTDYLMIGYNELWRIRDEKFTTVDQKEHEEIFDKRIFDIYQNENYIGHYKLLPLENGMYQYRSDNGVLTDIYPTLIAYSSINNTEFKVIQNVDSRPVTSSEFAELEQYIPDEAKTSYTFNELMTNYKLTYDFDKDGIDESIYSLGTLFNDDYSDSEYVFQVVLYRDDSGTVQEVVNETVNNTASSERTVKIEENRIIKENIKKENNSSSMPAQDRDDRKDIIRSSIYTMTNSLDKANIDYNRVINDMVNPNNNNVIKIEDNTKKEENIKKENVIKDENIIKESIKKENNTVNNIKEDIMKKAQNDINNYNIRKANNTVERASFERALKDSNDEGIYLVEYSESTGAITLIFRSRKFNNNSSIKEAIDELLIGATDEENNRNIISCIPKGTELLDIFVEGNTVYLNFNENFEFNPLGSEGTMVQIYQFVYTATQFEGIDNVIFLINGELHETIGSEGAIENMPFKRFE